MSKLLPIIGGISGTAIIGGAGAYLISTQKAPGFRDTFKEAIIDFDTEKELVYGKLTKLKAAKDIKENSRFKKPFDEEKKQDKQGFEELKKVCIEIYDSNSTKKDSDIFKDFQSYCARTNKDKVSDEQWATNSAVWTTRYGKIKKKTKTPLSSTLISSLNAESDENNGNKLKEWCEKIADSIYEGEENLEHKDAKVFCGKTD